VVGLADTDSYVKWAAALLGRLPDGSTADLLIVETALAVSPAQQETALARSGLGQGSVRRVEFARLTEQLAALRPDVVLVAARGPVARVLIRLAAELTPRPVIVSGLPGISIPVTTAALIHRTQSDLFLLHSRREVREFAALAEYRGLAQNFALAQLPFAAHVPASGPTAGATDLVFATQALVPSERAERMQVAKLLVAAAEADPRRRVVVKERAVKGEHQTHRQRIGIPDLLATLGPLPPNLVVSTIAMGRALDSAEGLVTVSSTAAIEAIARGIPVIALDSFGVTDKLINPVFLGSGLLAPESAVIARDFRQPAVTWRADNYFHDADADDWIARIEALVARRRAGELPAKPPRDRRGGVARDIWERKVALGRKDRSAAGLAVATVGIPMRFAVKWAHRLARIGQPKAQPVAYSYAIEPGTSRIP